MTTEDQNQNADNTGANNTDTGAQQADAEKLFDKKDEQKAEGQDQQKQQTEDNANADQKAEGDDGKKEGEGSAEGDKKDDAKKDGAPEKYEFKAAEGVTFDANMQTKFSEVARKYNLTQDAAQDLIDTMAPVIAAGQQDAIKAMSTRWKEETVQDKEYGGASYEANMAAVAKARDAIASQGLRELLDKTGMGNHPEMVRMFYRVGKAISEDSIVNRDNSHKEPPKDAASVLFPNMKNTA